MMLVLLLEFFYSLDLSLGRIFCLISFFNCMVFLCFGCCIYICKVFLNLFLEYFVFGKQSLEIEVFEFCLDVFFDFDNFLDFLDVLEFFLCSFIFEEEFFIQCEKNVLFILINFIIYMQLFG